MRGLFLPVDFKIITLFPSVIKSYFKESVIRKALDKGLIRISFYNPRDFCFNKKRPDDRPYGGGPGMVLKVEPIIRAVDYILSETINKKKEIILFSPVGRQFDNKMAAEIAKKYKEIILICGHYEGIDERVKKVLKNNKFKVKELSIGPYILTGGELPALVLIDAVSRQIKGVLGKIDSLEERRMGFGMPTFTRPEVFTYKNKNYKVPKVLLSGNHKKIEEWRKKHIKRSEFRS